MADDFHTKYSSTARNKHEFSVSNAIMTMIETNTILSKFVNVNFDLGINFATKAWNLAIINDWVIIKLLIKIEARELTAQSDKTQKQIEIMLNSLIKLKQKLYPDVYRYIADYSSAPDENGNSYLKLVSGGDEAPDYFATKYRKALFGDQKYGWVKNDN